jgi:hypothetical protein
MKPIVLFVTDRVKAEMDLKELSETVQHQQQQQGSSLLLTTPKRPMRSLDKTIESCKAQLGTHILSHTIHELCLEQGLATLVHGARVVSPFFPISSKHS